MDVAIAHGLLTAMEAVSFRREDRAVMATSTWLLESDALFAAAYASRLDSRLAARFRWLRIQAESG